MPAPSSSPIDPAVGQLADLADLAKDAGDDPPGPKERRGIAVDGKTLRGSGHDGGDGHHLLAALDHAHGVVLGQVEVGAKTNEIPLFTTLLDRLDIQNAVITADALHAQRSHATYLTGRGAHYLLIVKRNQPNLHAQLAAQIGRASC